MTAVFVLLAGYGSVVAAAYFGQRVLMYPAPPPAPLPTLPGVQRESFEVPSVGTGHALYRPAEPGAPTLVHFHGNGEQLSDQAFLLRALGARGLGVYAVEYPGYGPSAGNATSERSVYATAQAALDHLDAKFGVASSGLVLMGQSLGSGVAIEMAVRGRGARLVLVSPYTSFADMGKRMLPFVPVRALLKDHYDNLAKTSRVQQPTLVVHGRNDGVVPFAMGEKIAAAIRGSRFVETSRGHNDIWNLALVDQIAAFAREP